jgi:Na+/proline symporter
MCAGYLPVVMSQLLWGRAGAFLMYALTLAVVISLLSSQIISIVSIFVYDIYQTYIDSYTTPITSSCAETGDSVKHARRLKFIKILASLLSSVAVFVAAILMLQLEIKLPWMFKLIGIIAGSSVIPVFLSITWHRTTGIGVLMGVLLGFACGLIGWLVYASTFDGGVTVDNTGRPLVFITGVTLSLGVGGLVCLLFSLFFGGCRSTLLEDEEWEKTAQIDSIVSPWAERYAAYVDSVNYHTKRPHYLQVRIRSSAYRRWQIPSSMTQFRPQRELVVSLRNTCSLC